MLNVGDVDIDAIDLLQIKQYEKLECLEERRKLAREIYDNFIMKELLAHSHVSCLPAFCERDTNISGTCGGGWLCL
jgi:hypothetical protein